MPSVAETIPNGEERGIGLELGENQLGKGVEHRRFELLTFSLRTRRSTN